MNRQYTLEVAGRLVPYSVHFSGKAKRLSLRISPDTGLVFVVPKRLRRTDVNYEALLKTKGRWIVQKLDNVAKLQNQQPGVSFTDGSKLDVVGKEIILRVIHTSQKRASVRLEGEVLLVLTPEVGELQVRKVVTAWYKHVAKNIIPERVDLLNAPLGFPCKKVAVRDQKSRWGSCSRRGTLSFNWRMLLVPPSAMDYLIYHELAHLKEMNHSIRFWRLVRTLCPTYAEAEHWLKKNGRVFFGK